MPAYDVLCIGNAIVDIIATAEDDFIVENGIIKGAMNLIDAERARRPDSAADPLLSYLVEEPPGRGREETSVRTLDRDLYGE